MATREDKILSGLRDMEEYLRTKDNPSKLRVTHVPDNVDIKSIRLNMSLSQKQFAELYGFPLGTIQNWEQGRRQPDGTARILLKIIQSKPHVVSEILHATPNPQACWA